jgi:hypothetical protein
MSSSIKITGLDELTKNLDRLSDKLEDATKPRNVQFSELFGPAFMTRHTSFSSFDEMVKKSPFKVESQEDFKAIPDAAWDDYVQKSTKFSSWQKMISNASEEYWGKIVKNVMK